MFASYNNNNKMLASYFVLFLLCMHNMPPSCRAWGGVVENYYAQRHLTGRIARSWGYSIINPIMKLFGAQPYSDDYSSSSTVGDNNNFLYQMPSLKSVVGQDKDSPAVQRRTGLRPIPKKQLPTAAAHPSWFPTAAPIRRTPSPPITTTTTTLSSLPTTRTGEIILEIACDPVQYRRPVHCPAHEEGYFKLGSSCYFVSSASVGKASRHYTLNEARNQCSLMNDASGQSLGHWHLLTINNHVEESYMAPLLNLIARGDDNKGELLWVSQMAPVPTVDDAIALGSPFVYTTNCAGPVSIAKTDSRTPEILAQLLSSPVGCNILTTRDDDNIAGMEPECENTRLPYVCEVELDGDRSNFLEEFMKPNSAVSSSSLGRGAQNNMRRLSATARQIGLDDFSEDENDLATARTTLRRLPLKKKPSSSPSKSITVRNPLKRQRSAAANTNHRVVPGESSRTLAPMSYVVLTRLRSERQQQQQLQQQEREQQHHRQQQQLMQAASLHFRHRTTAAQPRS